MRSLTYTEIIDEKIAEWRSGLKKLEELAQKAAPHRKSDLISKTRKLSLAVNRAIVQLQNLDEKETVENTLAVKDDILAIFSSIDREFQGHEEGTPFML